MGFFSDKKADHRRALAATRQLVDQYATGEESFDLKDIPVEFRRDLDRVLTNLQWHAGNTTDEQIGDGDHLRELQEDLHFATLICSGKYSMETQRNFRTSAFDSTLDALTTMPKDKSLWEGPVGHLSQVSFERWIQSGEIVLSWLSEMPAPESKKYSAVEARTILASAKQFLAGISEPPKPTRAAEPPPAPANAVPASAQQPVCAGCGTANDSDAAFCKRCGTKMPQAPTCSSCGLTNDEDARFCKRCGTRIPSTGETSTSGGRAVEVKSAVAPNTLAPIVHPKLCSSCGHKNRGDAYQCSRCKHLFGRQK